MVIFSIKKDFYTNVVYSLSVNLDRSIGTYTRTGALVCARALYK